MWALHEDAHRHTAHLKMQWVRSLKALPQERTLHACIPKSKATSLRLSHLTSDLQHPGEAKHRCHNTIYGMSGFSGECAWASGGTLVSVFEWRVHVGRRHSKILPCIPAFPKLRVLLYPHHDYTLASQIPRQRPKQLRKLLLPTL